MKLMVFPLSVCLLVCLLPPSTCLHDGRTARRLSSHRRGFLPPSSDLAHFPLSGFFPTDNNHVDTPFTVPGLDGLPPLHSINPQQEGNSLLPNQPKTETNSRTIPARPRADPTKPNHPSILKKFTKPKPSALRPTHFGDIFSNLRPSGSFPTLYNPFKNFFNYPLIPPNRYDPVPAAVPTSSKAITTAAPPVTTPRTTPRPLVRVATPSTRVTPVRAIAEEDRFLNRDSVHVYHSSDYGDLYNDYPSDDVYVDDDDASDYPDYDDYDVYNTNTVKDDYLYPQDDSDPSSSCPGSLRECLTACSPVISINQVAYKLCVNECLDRCQ